MRCPALPVYQVPTQALRANHLGFVVLCFSRALCCYSATPRAGSRAKDGPMAPRIRSDGLDLTRVVDRSPHPCRVPHLREELVQQARPVGHAPPRSIAVGLSLSGSNPSVGSDDGNKVLHLHPPNRLLTNWLRNFGHTRFSN